MGRVGVTRVQVAAPNGSHTPVVGQRQDVSVTDRRLHGVVRTVTFASPAKQVDIREGIRR